MPKFGEVREDGFRFRGYQTRDGKRYEQWCSPEAWEARKKRQTQHARSKRNAIQLDAKALAEWREQAAAYMRSSRRARPVSHMLTKARARARERGLAFDITREDVVIPERCPVLDIQLFIGDGQATDNSPELDRIDNSRGYVKGNVIVVSRRANRIKNDATVEELERIARFYRELAGDQ